MGYPEPHQKHDGLGVDEDIFQRGDDHVKNQRADICIIAEWSECYEIPKKMNVESLVKVKNANFFREIGVYL